MADGHDRGGYGKPPKSGQFKPGQSGNPAGRPRKSKIQTSHSSVAGMTSIDRVILEESRRLVKAREGDQIFELTQEQAVIRSIIAKAIKGSPMAQRTIIAENQRVHALEMRRRQEIWDSAKSYVAWWSAAAERAKSQGKPAPTMLPHPADIEFADDLHVYVRGPTDADDLKKAVVRANFRDLYLAMMVYVDDRPSKGNDSDQHINFWMYATLVWNSLLPPSLRLSTDELHARAYHLIAVRRPKLEEHIAALCSRVGWTFRVAQMLARGRTTIDLRFIGLQRVAGVIVKGRRIAPAKLVELLWTDIPVNHLTAERLDLLISVGLAGPPSWVARARAAISARE